MNAIDTNVWIYSHDKRDEEKYRVAQGLIATLEPMALLWQVGCEFIAASRKLEPFGFHLQDAWEALADMQTMADIVLLPNCDTWSIARDIQQRRGIQFWDALILAVCIQGGVKTLYSEDFGEQGPVDGINIVNPFG